MNIYITSCDKGEKAWRDHENNLKSLYELSDKCHTLVDVPEKADLILIGNLREENWGERVINHPIINKYPANSFSLSDYDNPLFLHHGIFASGHFNLFSYSRVRTGSYTIDADKYKNPYINSQKYINEYEGEKKYLFSFIGRKSHPIRTTIFNLKYQRQDIILKDSYDFDLWGEYSISTDQRQKSFCDLMLDSKFSLCPRGLGVNTIRLYESLQLGVAPIIISDAWIPPIGPDWEEFSIRIKEKNIRGIEEIVSNYENKFKEMGEKAKIAYENFFSKSVYFNYIINNCNEIKNTQKIPESWYWKNRLLIIFFYRLKDKLRFRTRMKFLLYKNGIRQ